MWCPPPRRHAAGFCSSLSVCSRPMHRRTIITTASAVSTSPPERPPPSPAAAHGASRTTTSAPTPSSADLDTSQSPLTAPSRSLLCVPPCTRRVAPCFPAAAHPPRTHAPGPHCRPLALRGVVGGPRAASSFLAQRVLAPDAPQDQHNHRIRRVDITTGATTTLAGSGVSGFKDDDVGTNAQFKNPYGVAIAPDGAFVLVAVRAPCTRRAVPFPRSGAPASHTRLRLALPPSRPPRCGGHRHTPRRRLAPRSACVRVRCTTGPY